MINTPFVQRYQTYPLQMDALECVKTSPPLPRCLLDIVEKVIRVVMIPFALILDFFINLVRSVANVCLSLANWVAGPLPNAPPILVRSGENGALEIVSTPVLDNAPPLPDRGSIVAEETPSQAMEEAIPAPEMRQSSATTAENPQPMPQPMELSSPTMGVTTSSSPSSPLATPTTVAVPAPIAYPTLARLPCTETQVGQINQLLTTLGTKSKTSILWNEQTNLSNLGAAIRDIHPLKFLSIACSTPQGIAHIQAIFSDTFKHLSFMSYKNSTTPSFTDKLDAEAKKGNLEMYLSELAQGAKLAAIQIDVRNKNWNNLVKHLAGIPVPS